MSAKRDARLALKKATARAKSDVANKAVSMFLHEVSKRIVEDMQFRITKPEYADAFEDVFGNHCPYCGEFLTKSQLAVEHLEGMNRARVGLHIPGNVVVACVPCNREKRRDDQEVAKALAPSGWESFLSHTGERCRPDCKTCHYWAGKFPDKDLRNRKLAYAIKQIQSFRSRFGAHLARVDATREIIRKDVEALYRECQDFATKRIDQMTEEVVGEIRKLRVPNRRDE